MIEQGNSSVVMVQISLDSTNSGVRQTLVFSKSGLFGLCVFSFSISSA
jgi:hypothetical protein